MNWKNVGGADRIVRALLGTTALALALSPALEGMPRIVSMVLGVVLVGTSVLGSCPLYLPFGLSSCKKD